ncbi:DUF3224 domain-containing protein [Kitasatospora sp. NBC_01287]|uniref:DUF3224 domain-containing protein n=1 Tax=Kitasatospora sp. NBC_01287 TaxID=2903573 RepID=UPI00224DFB46|nr:DUF3224 domain-containing protein [Kitasatospora sp. NBC_01287]MCX4747834.1 DUF3224 domain-containing protein [Kitasatospora sp. NBC_01287]
MDTNTTTTTTATTATAVTATTAVTTIGTFTFAGWEELPLAPTDPLTAPRLARAAVTNDFTGGLTATGTTCQYTMVYATEKTGLFNGFELITGTLDGRAGAFVVEQRGSFHEDGGVRCVFEVVPGSGTGALAGLRGSGDFTSRHGESSVDYTFTYEGLDRP